MPRALEHLAALVEEYPEEAAYRLELAITSYLAGKPGLALENTCLLPETAETVTGRVSSLKTWNKRQPPSKAWKNPWLYNPISPIPIISWVNFILPAATMEKPGTIF